MSDDRPKEKRLATLRLRLKQWTREKDRNGPRAEIADQTIELIGIEIAREEKRHIESPKCWCLPTLDFVASNGNQVWVHHEPN